MSFDPDKYLAKKGAFDPDAYLAATAPAGSPQPISFAPEIVTMPTIDEEFFGRKPIRTVLGALGIPMAAMQLGGNLGEFIADKTGLRGKFGKTTYAPMPSKASMSPEQYNALIDANMRVYDDSSSVNKLLQKLETTKRRGMSYYSGKPIGEDWDVAGGLGAVGSGIGLIKSMGIPLAATAKQRIVQGGGFGGLLSALTPDTSGGDNYAGDLALKTGLGTVLGAALPIGWEGSKLAGRGVRNVVEPWLGKWGLDRSVGRTARGVAGDLADDVVTALKGHVEPIAGVKSTASQAALPAGSAEFSALGEIARRKIPSTYIGIDTKNALAVKAAEEARKIASTINYGVVARDTIKINKEILALSQSQVFQKAQQLAMKTSDTLAAVAKSEGTLPIPFTNKGGYTVHGLQLTKQALDGLIKDPTSRGQVGLAGVDQAALIGMKNQLVKIISQQSPGWEKARAAHQVMSKDINKFVDSGDILKDYATKGMPAARASINEIKDFYQGMPILERGMVIFTNIINRIEGGISKRTGLELALKMQNPQEMARVMAASKPFERQAMLDFMAKYQAPFIAASIQEQQNQRP